MSERATRLTRNARLTVRAWRRYVFIRARIRRTPLPAVVAQLRREGPGTRRRHPPSLLSRAVDRSLKLGRHRATCLEGSLVLFALLHEQGDLAELVIGLPEQPQDHAAHAWIELEGVDVGPPPGRSGHTALARFA